MKKVFLLFISVATLLGCSKNNDNPFENNENYCQLASIYQGDRASNYFQENLEYDNQGRLTSVRYKSSEVYNGDIDIAETNYKIQYSDVSITVEDDGEFSGKTIYYIEGGKIIRDTNLDSDQKVRSTTEYTYNSANQLIRTKTQAPRNVFQVSLEYKNGNLVSIKEEQTSSENQNGGWSSTSTIQYNQNEARSPYIEYVSGNGGDIFLQYAYSAAFYEQGLLGVKSKNKMISVINEDRLDEIVYGPKDKKGNITELAIKGDPDDEKKVLTYKCSN
ncbi:DUF4595 domain-containing protein [Sphingobacterium faecale]|uniref:DUF4595 domain-containing protein n=1 Tax=Sphingobacterium faecale TaxID=2803775 RepID=A0ABS1R4F3_9SPHI|nr:DUF4595 domain-containing protein [Sphingobacterium faecale]MBL1409568.1 DUF4595 domain-containing protein [Sphingobacterium faecale]